MDTNKTVPLITQMYPEYNNTVFYHSMTTAAWNESDVMLTMSNYTAEQSIQSRLARFFTQPHQIIAVVLSLTAIWLNVFSLLAIFKVKHRLTTHFLFIVSLAISDITIGVSVMLYVLNKVINQSYMPGNGPWDERLVSRCAFISIKCLNSTSLNISLLNLIAMATDHFIAIIKPLHYHSIMTKKRVSVLLIVLWAISIFFGYVDFFTGIKWHSLFKQYYNYCEIVWLTPFHEEYVTFVLALLCLVAMAWMYGLIYRKIQTRQRPGTSERLESTQIKRKPLVTTLLILGSFILCWLPMCLFQITLIIIVKLSPDTLVSMGSVLIHADQYLYNLLLLNCIADPIIYAIRMHEIRLGYQRLCCFCCLRNVLIRRDTSRNYLINAARQDQRHSVCITLSNNLTPLTSMSKASEQNTVE